MLNATVEDILTLIDQLPEMERQRLDDELHAQREAEWEVTSAAMRRDAKQRGIDQETIDRAIHEHRYGS